MRIACSGIPVSSGISIGKTLLLQKRDLPAYPKEAEDSQKELARYHRAVKSFCEKMEAEARKVSSAVGAHQSEILRTHILMLQDPYMNGQIEGKIVSMQSAESAVEAVCNSFADLFLNTQDPITIQRVADIRDIQEGLLRILLDVPEPDLSRIEAGTVLVADELAPSVVASLDPRRVVGLLTKRGGKTSHCAILARALEIPCVQGIELNFLEIPDGEAVVIDGETGKVVFSPEEEELVDYRTKRAEYLQSKVILDQFRQAQARTADGERIFLLSNGGTLEDGRRSMELLADGIGLLRTELFCLDTPVYPDEEEQFRLFRQYALTLEGKPLTIRVLDVGGDKFPSYLHLEQEDNPFLGLRGYRLLLSRPELLHVQLKAILRASPYGKLQVLVPFITDVEELRSFRRELESTKEELGREGKEFGAVPVGVMIETPSAVITADILAREADFLSIGTNDLAQYMLCVDRGNARVDYLYSHYAPSLLRAVKQVADSAKKANTPVCLCGEAASNGFFLPLALGFGIRNFSVVAASLLKMRREISLWTMEEAVQVAEKALSLTSADEVERFLKSCTPKK